ncbi:MAG: hypothetical protein WC911_09465 [Thermoleophilia bacterium]
MLKVKILAIAVVLLLGVAGVALASGQVSGSAGDNISVQNGSGGTESPDSASDELSDAAGNQYGPDTEADDDASEDQYSDDDQDEADDMDDMDDEADDINDDADEVGDQENDHESDRHVNGSDSANPLTGTQSSGHDSGESDNETRHAGAGSVTNAGNTGATNHAAKSTRHENDD